MANILVVDDNGPVRTALARIITALGHAVLQAGDGREAVALLGSTAVDVVLTDVYMPDMDGIEFLLHLQEHHPDLPVVAMSGGGVAPRDSVLEDALQLGATAVLQKPVTREIVAQALEEALLPPSPPRSRPGNA